MTDLSKSDTTVPRRYSPLGQLVLARLREFYREPEAIFWVYGFPILMVIALGIAFRNKPVTEISVDVVNNPGACQLMARLSDNSRFKLTANDLAVCRQRWKTGKTDAVVEALDGPGPRYRCLYDPNRTESVMALYAVQYALERQPGTPDLVEPKELQEPGSRYIDFLVPGLLGMSLMGGGLWGVGYVIVDMRIRKLLKRFLATPMKKSHFLAAIMISRLAFMIPEVLVLLLFSWLVFGVVIQGNLAAVLVLILLGAFTFAGIGLLVASRAKTLESVSGLMNLVMLPMWLLSGIFFSAERFPDAAQPFIKALPLTPLIDALRAVIQEGEPLATQLPRLGILAAWAVGTFGLALRWFRWN
jgi:ABC-type multidrug transport system permease subunit